MESEADPSTEERPDVTAESEAPPAPTAVARQVPLDVALDDEGPFEIEKTFAILCALGGVMCLVPRQWWSAVVLLSLSALSLLLFLLRRRRADRA